MRNIHLHLRREYCKENVQIFWQWNKIENKMAYFSNHRRFSLRCLSEDIIHISIRLKSNIKTPKGYYIIKKAERALLNKMIRSFNNTINMPKIQRDTCKNHLHEILDRGTMGKCESFIKVKRKSKHLKTFECQRQKFERLCQKYKKTKSGYSNIQHGNQDQTSPITELDSNFNTNSTNSTNNTQVRNNSNNSTNSNNNTWIRNISITPQQKHR